MLNASDIPLINLKQPKANIFIQLWIVCIEMLYDMLKRVRNPDTESEKEAEANFQRRLENCPGCRYQRSMLY